MSPDALGAMAALINTVTKKGCQSPPLPQAIWEIFGDQIHRMMVKVLNGAPKHHLLNVICLRRHQDIHVSSGTDQGSSEANPSALEVVPAVINIITKKGCQLLHRRRVGSATIFESQFKHLLQKIFHLGLKLHRKTIHKIQYLYQLGEEVPGMFLKLVQHRKMFLSKCQI